MLQIHYLGEEDASLFDIIVDFDAPDRMQVRDNILNKIKSKYPKIRSENHNRFGC